MALPGVKSMLFWVHQHFCSISSAVTCRTVQLLACDKQYQYLSPIQMWPQISRRGLHASSSLGMWELKNQRIYPPQKPDEPRRPAEMFYAKRNIKHSKRKMWYAATFVKGMMIDDALIQLRYVNKKAATIVSEVLLEAQEQAMSKHNFEYKSNMYIAASFSTRAASDHAARYHAKGRSSVLDLVYCHYFVCLKEGSPPQERVYNAHDQAEDYVKLLRKRNIPGSL